MQTNTHKNPYVMAPPRLRAGSVPRANTNDSVASFIKLLLVSITFALFCAAITGGVWYFWKLFQNDSYKLVSSFLLLILVANIVCKYGLWYLRNYGYNAPVASTGYTYTNAKFMKKS